MSCFGSKMKKGFSVRGHGVDGYINNSKSSSYKIPPTLKAGGGRDWILNIKDQTISPKHDDSFVLGTHPFTPLVLTNKGEPNQITFPKDQLKALQSGQEGSISLSGVGLQYPKEDMKEYTGWLYTEAATGQDLVLSLQYVDENFLVAKDNKGMDMVLDISFWQYTKDNTVNFVRSAKDDGSKKNKHWWDAFFKPKTFLYGGGRDWIINVEDGTISPTHAPYLVLGFGPKRLILTTKGSPAKQKFDNLDKLANGETATLTLSDSDKGLGKMYTDERYAGPWRYIESEMVGNEDAVPVKYVMNNYIATAEEGVEEDKALVLDVSYWIMMTGNTVNFVGGWSYE